MQEYKGKGGYVPGSLYLLYVWTFTRKYITIYLVRCDLDVLHSPNTNIAATLHKHNIVQAKVSVVINKDRIVLHQDVYTYTLNKWHRSVAAKETTDDFLAHEPLSVRFYLCM